MYFCAARGGSNKSNKDQLLLPLCVLLRIRPRRGKKGKGEAAV